jgi:hypothetical protein
MSLVPTNALLLVVLLAVAVTLLTLGAEDTSAAATAARSKRSPSYLTDAYGNPIRNGQGGLIRTKNQYPDLQTMQANSKLHPVVRGMIAREADQHNRVRETFLGKKVSHLTI